MNTKLISTCVVIGALMGPFAARAADRAADGDADRATPTAFVKDSVITTKIKAKLAEDKMSTLANVHVDTDRNGVVVLSGDVANAKDAAAATSIARDTEGVKSVQNHIKVKNGG
jgi:hyperosmotically inducible protein